jgi:two-component system, OmpR family, alkaline phosphatase synthesis response regulator PhoP
MRRILALSTDAEHVAIVEAAARPDGHAVRSASNPEQCLIAVRDWRPEVLVVDLLHGMSGAGLSALLRDDAIIESVAVLAIVGPAQVPLVGAGVKVDDFLLSPLDEDELRTRLARIIWNRTGAGDGSVVQHGSLVIDIERYKVTVGEEVVDLTYKEYELLRFLASNPGKPFTREALLNQVWGYDYYGGSRTVDVHVRRIRAKIERREQFVETVRNVGYRFLEAPSSGEGARR